MEAAAPGLIEAAAPVCSTACLADDCMSKRKDDAFNDMPKSIARLVEAKEQLVCSSGNQTFCVTDVIDGGGFATLLKGQIHIKSPRMSQIAAAKIAVDMETDKDGQLTDQQRRSYQASMRHEHRIYERLQTPQSSGNGIPRVYFAGGVKKAGDPDHPKKLQFLSFLVMEHLGHSIGCLSLEMQTYTNNRKLLVNHGLGMLKVLRFMHQHNIVHRDIKPDNFVLPYGSDPLNPTPDDTVYVVDMGMAQQISPDGFDWEAQDCLYMGTVDYSSVRALRGYNPSGWDDLESLAIALLEMATGNVPFDLLQGHGPLMPDRLHEMAAQKEKHWQKILADDQTPNFIKQWMRHLRSAPPRQHPAAADYSILQDILQSAAAPLSAPASSAWSCDVSVLQVQPAAAATTVVSSKKRPAPTLSAASNLVSCMSETATIMHPKRVKLCPQQDEDDGISMATGLVGFSQGILLSQAAEE